MRAPYSLLHGDALSVLRGLPSESVHACVTSPPYYSLRDYGQDGQIGLEPTPDAYVARLVEVFAEVRRVLRSDGSLWLNIGDSYAAGGRGNGSGECKQRTNTGSLGFPVMRAPDGTKPKDLLGIPWMVAFALRADGWYLRSDIVWAKPNPMPESVTDRPTKAHEYVFLLTKASRYFYDADAVRETASWGRENNPDWREQRAETNGKKHATNRNAQSGGFAGWSCEQGRNLRSVWNIATQPYPGAHFATFPEALVEPCIKAGTSERGVCAACGAPWRRVTEKGEADAEWQAACGADSSGGYNGHATKDYASARAEDPSSVKARILAGMRKRQTVAWRPSCDCPRPERLETIPATVLDPFCGSGTTLAVATRLGRLSIGIDLSEPYLELARHRILYGRAIAHRLSDEEALGGLFAETEGGK